MKLSPEEHTHFKNCIKDLLAHQQVQEMKLYIQHGNTTTLKHSIMVSYYSYWLCKRIHLPCNIRSVARGALLHDFYLYDWHESDGGHRLHGFFHSGTALRNARKYFKLNHIEEDIIAKHMWPLTITKLPVCRESVVVSFVDKFCSAVELIPMPYRGIFEYD